MYNDGDEVFNLKSKAIDVRFMFVDDMCQSESSMLYWVSHFAPNDVNVANVAAMQSCDSFPALLSPEKLDGFFGLPLESGVDGAKGSLL